MNGGQGDPFLDAGTLALGVAESVNEADYARPTPCDAWDVRGVLNAMVVKADLFARAVDEPVLDKPTPWPDALGDDPKTSLRAAVTRVLGAYTDPTLERTVVLPLGQVPWTAARGVVMLDLTLH